MGNVYMYIALWSARVYVTPCDINQLDHPKTDYMEYNHNILDSGIALMLYVVTRSCIIIILLYSIILYIVCLGVI